jgi:hypothetical protein
MGTSRNAVELARKLDAYAAKIPDANQRATAAGGLAVKNAVLPLMRAATGGDLMLSGTGRATTVSKTKGVGTTRERRIGVRYSALRRGTGVIVGAQGPAHLVERDVKPHIVFSRFAKVGGRKARSTTVTATDGTKRRVDLRALAQVFGVAPTGDRRAVLNLGNDVYRRWTRAHSKGRRPWERGVALAEPRVRAEWRATHRRDLVESFR